MGPVHRLKIPSFPNLQNIKWYRTPNSSLIFPDNYK